MATQAKATFAIEEWDEEIYDQPAVGSKLLRATVRKSFQGDLDGTSVAELQMVRAGEEGGEGYLGTERVNGRLNGRSGTFVLQHGGMDSGDELFAFGYVIKDSGTGELAGLSGKASFQHDETGAVFTLDYDLPER
jgi:hypothetical protein